MANGDDSLPVTALLATQPGVPVTVFDSNAALRMAVVDRLSLAGLDEVWDAPGVYILLDPPGTDGTYGAYVGKAPSGVRGRLREHASRRGRESWTRAVTVVRDTTHGWHAGQVGWLEGRLYALLEGAAAATLSNGNRPQDETVPPYDRAALETAVEPIAALLRLLGFSPDAEDDVPAATPSRRRTPKQHPVTFNDLIAAGALIAGEPVTSTMAAYPASGRINADGTISVDGQTFSSPSAAGGHVRNGGATNGWQFWAVERDGTTVPLATIRARHQEQAQPPPSKET